MDDTTLTPATTHSEADEPLTPAVRSVVFKESIDLRLPILGQLAAVGDDYDGWVHSPISPSRAEKIAPHVTGKYANNARRWSQSLRIFESPLLEWFSHIRWWHILVVWIPIVVALFLGSVGVLGSVGTLSWLPALGWAVGGLFFWTLVEYSLHRFAFHYKPRSAFGRKLHFLAHGVHHLDPWDPTRLVFPPLAGIMIISAIFGLVWIVLPLDVTMAWIAGMLVGYITYDMTHYYTHHGRPTSRWGKFLKTYHLAHHHKEWEAMYGVSSPLWDIVFRTGPSAGTGKAATKRRESRPKETQVS